MAEYFSTSNPVISLRFIPGCCFLLQNVRVLGLHATTNPKGYKNRRMSIARSTFVFFPFWYPTGRERSMMKNAR